MPSNPWRRRRSADNPRPAGRRWTRSLRHGGSIARRVLAGHRRSDRVLTFTARSTSAGAESGLPGLSSRPRMAIAPVSPAAAIPVAPAESATPSGPVTIPLLPGDLTLARRLKFGVVNACTVASILLGLSAVFLAFQGEARLGALMLLGCVAFDGVDGGLARRLGVASPFGAQMDSLADMSSFGVAAPLVGYFWLAGHVPLPVLAPLCVLMTVCAAIRLARFNVSPKDGRYFSGVPTTMAAAILAVTVVLNPQPASPVVPLAILGGLGLLMVTSFPYPKLAQVATLPPWLWVLPVFAAFVDAFATFALLVAAYLLSGPLLWLKQRQRRRAEAV